MFDLFDLVVVKLNVVVNMVVVMIYKGVLNWILILLVDN